MPPKKKSSGDSKKTEERKQEKIIQDRTFGLKNKKSASVQKVIKGIAQKVKGPVKGSEQFQIAEAHRLKEEKKKEQANSALIAALFKTVVTIKETDGQDPKTIVCPYYKQGICKKGDKCKFSHNLNPQLEKPDLYRDDREIKADIICKFFMEAVVNKKHGWFWKCPNGEECIYRHCFPEGFIIPDPDSDVVAEIEEEDIIPLEDQLEEERQKLPPGGTPVTRESFYAWLERKNMRQAAKEEEERKAGLRPSDNMKEKFSADPNVFVDDDSAMEEYKVDEDNQAEEEKEEEKVEEPEKPVPEGEEDAGATYYIPEEETVEESKAEQGEKETQLDQIREGGQERDDTENLDQPPTVPVTSQESAPLAEGAEVSQPLPEEEKLEETKAEKGDQEATPEPLIEGIKKVDDLDPKDPTVLLSSQDPPQEAEVAQPVASVPAESETYIPQGESVSDPN